MRSCFPHCIVVVFPPKRNAFTFTGSTKHDIQINKYGKKLLLSAANRKLDEKAASNFVVGCAARVRQLLQVKCCECLHFVKGNFLLHFVFARPFPAKYNLNFILSTAFQCESELFARARPAAVNMHSSANAFSHILQFRFRFFFCSRAT